VQTNQELARLAALAKDGCALSRERLIVQNSPLIKSIIKRYIGKGVDYDDLYQLGALGFVKAIHKFDPTVGVKFTTYAVPLIAGEVKRFLRDDGSIKVSRSTKTLYSHIKRFIASRQADETPPTIEQIATELGVTREEVIYAMEAASMPVSLAEKSEGSGDGDGQTLEERVASPVALPLDDKLMLKNLLAELEDRERKVIILRFFRNQTQSQIAKRLGISQVQVSRIEQRVIDQWRAQLTENVA